jgi:hypothetical protein
LVIKECRICGFCLDLCFLNFWMWVLCFVVFDGEFRGSKGFSI